jgi:hypothetical protein
MFIFDYDCQTAEEFHGRDVSDGIPAYFLNVQSGLESDPVSLGIISL